MKKLVSKKGWLEEIADKSEYSKEVVKDTINKYQVRQNPNIATPRRLQIKEISFSGVKKGVQKNPFNFRFDGLGAGVYGFITDENLRGKTTVLEVIKWLLRGSVSSDFQLGVKNWIKKADLKFKIDEHLYLLSLEQIEEEVEGILTIVLENEKKVIGEFHSNDEFENCMSKFMMREFSLDDISAFRVGKIAEEVGQTVNHSWPSLASALFISTNYTSLFGETVADGLNNRLMNMYLGLPWISTFISLKTVEKQIKSETKVEKLYANKEAERKANRLKEINSELKSKQELLAAIPYDKDIKEKLKKERENYGFVSRQITSLDKEIRILSEENDLAEELQKNDLIKINNHKEDKAANVVFKRLNPTCCPHCEKAISKEKIEKEKKEHLCAVCDEPLLDSESSEAILNELLKNLELSKKAYKEINKVYKNKKSAHFQLSIRLQEIQKNIDNFDKELDKYPERTQLEQDILRLEILKEEYKPIVANSQTALSPEPINSPLVVDEKKIISAAIEVTKKRFEDLQKELLNEVNQEIMRISKLVGLSHMQSIKLSSRPSMSIVKDGDTTSYSKCTKGEKLRLKVITTIALLTVAERKKVGRHPGILLIDSPGAQEISDKDLESLIRGLKTLSNELSFIQIFVASRASEVILKHIDKEDRKYAKGNDYLW